MSMVQSQDKDNVDLTTELFLARIIKKYDMEKAILFGSYARDEAGVQSDMDIAILLRGIHGQRADTALDKASIAFGQYLIKPDLLEVDLGRLLNQVEQICLMADYMGSPFSLVNRPEHGARSLLSVEKDRMREG